MTSLVIRYVIGASVAFASAGAPAPASPPAEPSRDGALPPEATRLLSEHEKAVEAIEQDAASRLQKIRDRCLGRLANALEAERRAGDLEGVEVIERQQEALDAEVDGLPKAAEDALADWRRDAGEIAASQRRKTRDERARAVRELDRCIRIATAADRAAEAEAIQEHRDRLEEMVRAVDSEDRQAEVRPMLVGTWSVRAGPYRAKWTFRPDGTVIATDQKMRTKNGRKKTVKPTKDTVGTWEAKEQDVLVVWEGPRRWDLLRLPVKQGRMDGKNATEEPPVLVTKLDER